MASRNKTQMRPRGSHMTLAREPTSWNQTIRGIGASRAKRQKPVASPDPQPDQADSDEPEDENELPRHHPHTIIDWRRELCGLLELPPTTLDDDLLDAMGPAQTTLQEAKTLKHALSETQLPPRGETIYKITCHQNRTTDMYLDEPWVVESGRWNAHLRGSKALGHRELHLERNKEVTFLVYRNFECCGTAPPPDFNYHGKVANSIEHDTSSFLKTEYIELVSEDLREGFKRVAAEALNNIPRPDFDVECNVEIDHPYLWWFHRRKEIDMAIQSLDTEYKDHMTVAQNYICDRLSDDWNSVDTLLENGKMTAKFMHYLFIPDQILISQTDGTRQHELKGVVATDWLHVSRDSTQDRFHATIPIAFWDFRGSFRRLFQTLFMIRLPEADEDGKFLITDLYPVYPSEFASSETIENLRRRGQMHWKCRNRNYVSSCRFTHDSIQHSVDSRFMVDFETYTRLHGEKEPLTGDEDLGSVTMCDDSPDLGDGFFMCLPTTTIGYDMQIKNWVDLEVDFLEDVKWNDQAFEDLVIDTATKELVKAVVTTHLMDEENTDLIRGKGNGLFILLHGGPGTGKTLTAESVAEIARKPLYRVTCGDIGTKAEEAEEYLEEVLTLAKDWGCVVLLDEADVFLEERALQNLERNALVSIFLRVLEYYDGILILTTNRVGTFDEAFKSRIQLNLRYNNLTEQQRLKIWTNSIDRMEILDRERATARHETISSNRQKTLGTNVEEIRQHLADLAKAALNGREIRNTISTARQLALYRGKPLGYEHICSVINEARKFDDYMMEVRSGHTTDALLRARGER